MDRVERLAQMNEVERMREVMDILSDSMRKQNDKDRMEMLAMLASTTAMEANLMSVKFAHSANAGNGGGAPPPPNGVTVASIQAAQVAAVQQAAAAQAQAAAVAAAAQQQVAAAQAAAANGVESKGIVRM